VAGKLQGLASGFASGVRVFDRRSAECLLGQVNSTLIPPVQIFMDKCLKFRFGNFYSWEIVGY
jgi:hypothetical protein